MDRCKGNHLKATSGSNTTHHIARVLFVVFTVALLSLPATEQPVAAQGPKPTKGPSAATLSECLGSGQAKSSYHSQTGKVRFISTAPGKPLERSARVLRSASPESAARDYVSRCSSLFGLTDQSTELTVRHQKTLDRGRSLVRFQQVYQGIPVLAGELMVNLDSAKNILSVNGEILPDISVKTSAAVDAATAQRNALRAVADKYQQSLDELTATKPALWIYHPQLIQSEKGSAVLVWRVEVTSTNLAPIRELVLIDAQNGSVVLSINQIDTAMNRRTYTSGNSRDRPGTLVCDESSPTCSGGDADAINAHIYGGDTFNFYSTYHGRNSLDNAGMTLISSVHYSTNYCNAFWDGAQMTYGDGCFIVTDDVVAHEMTHGVTDYESNLIYAYESGAMNESFSDVWGEFVDLTNERGNDSASVRWLVGEDTSIGAIRNMQDPTALGDPDRMQSPRYYRGGSDNGGVHTNSGVNNKAAYLMTDGDIFNGYTVTGIGITKVAKIYYEAQANILTSGSDYADLYDALYQACSNLIPSDGINASDCQQVRNATLATEMNWVAPPPANDDVNNATQISAVPYSITNLDVTGATTALDDPTLACLSGQRSNSVWWRYTPSQNATLTIDTYSSNYDTVLAIWKGSRGSLTSLGCNDDTSGWQSQVRVSVTAGQTYYIEVASYSPGGGVLTLHATTQSLGNWVSKASMAVARSRSAVAAVNGKVYVIGGESATFGAQGVNTGGTVPKGGTLQKDVQQAVFETSTEEYDTATNTWAARASKPTGASGIGAGVINGKIYVPGGYDGSNALSVLEIYDPGTNGWSSGASLPRVRWGSATAAVNDKLYVMGGSDGSNYTSTCYVYDPATDSWSSCTAMTYARAYAAAGVVNGKIYVVGGRDGTVSDYSTVQEYNPATNTWQTRASMNTARGGPGAVGIGNDLYVCGGGWASYYNTCETYNPTTNSWSSFDAMNVGRRTFGLTVANGKLYAAAGWSGTYLADHEENAVTTCYALTTSANPSGGGSISSSPAPNCGTQYTVGTVVTLTATANAGYAFTSWSGNLTGSTNPSTITLSAARSVTASWTPSTTTTITAHTPSPSVVGQAIAITYTVTSSGGMPTGNVTVSDGAVNCTGTVAAGTCTLTPTSAGTKTLTATYAGNSSFGGSAGTAFHTVNNATPTLTALGPKSTTMGGAAFTLSIEGAGFVSNSVVQWDGMSVPTTFVSSTRLVASVTGGRIATPATASVTVVNPSPGGGTSNLLVFYVTEASAGVTTSNTGTGTNPSASTGGSQPVTVNATGTGTVSVALYSANPGGSPTFGSAGAYMDVYVASGSNLTGLTILDCNLNGGKVVYWWNGSVWRLASSQSYSAATQCVTITVNETTSPSLRDLTGTVFGAAYTGMYLPWVSR